MSMMITRLIASLTILVGISSVAFSAACPSTEKKSLEQIALDARVVAKNQNTAHTYQDDAAKTFLLGAESVKREETEGKKGVMQHFPMLPNKIITVPTIEYVKEAVVTNQQLTMFVLRNPQIMIMTTVSFYRDSCYIGAWQVPNGTMSKIVSAMRNQDIKDFKFKGKTDGREAKSL